MLGTDVGWSSIVDGYRRRNGRGCGEEELGELHDGKFCERNGLEVFWDYLRLFAHPYTIFCYHAEQPGYCIMLALAWRQGEISAEQPEEEGRMNNFSTRQIQALQMIMRLMFGVSEPPRTRKCQSIQWRVLSALLPCCVRCKSATDLAFPCRALRLSDGVPFACGALFKVLVNARDSRQ